jgi:hypothetical protein
MSSHQVVFGDTSAFVSNTIPRGDDQPNDTPQIYPQEIPGDDTSINPSIIKQPHDTSYHHHHPYPRDAGCQVFASNLNPETVIKEAKKLSLPYFDPTKMTWTSFAMKLHASLIECDLAYLLREPSTNHYNSAHSKELMLELFRKLQGSALSLFTSLKSQQYYLEGGRGIEMVKALVN